MTLRRSLQMMRRILLSSTTSWHSYTDSGDCQFQKRCSIVFGIFIHNIRPYPYRTGQFATPDGDLPRLQNSAWERSTLFCALLPNLFIPGRSEKRNTYLIGLLDYYGDHLLNALETLSRRFCPHYDVINWSSVYLARWHSYQISRLILLQGVRKRMYSYFFPGRSP